MNVYDFDGTIYNGDSTVDFFLYAIKKKPSLIRYIPQQALGFFFYLTKRIDKTRLKEYFFCFLKGTNATDLSEDFWESNKKKIFEWYMEQLEVDDVIITASPKFLVQPICQELYIKNVIASEVDPHTGKFSGKNCYGEEKVNRFQERFAESHIINFYSDSESDLPLAQLAEKSFLINKGKMSVWHKNNIS